MRNLGVLILVSILVLGSLPLMGCNGKRLSERIAKLQNDARGLAQEAVALQEEGNDNLARTRYQDAVKAYMEILDIAPNSYEARLNLGILYTYFGDYAKAEESLEKARVLSEDNGRVYFYLGSLALKQNDPHQARLLFGISIDKDPAYAPAHFFLGKTSYDSGFFYEAKKAFDEYLELDPVGGYATKAVEYLGIIPEDSQPPIDVEILPSPPGQVYTETTTPEGTTLPEPVGTEREETQPSEVEQEPLEEEEPEGPEEPEKTEGVEEPKEKPEETEKPVETPPTETTTTPEEPPEESEPADTAEEKEPVKPTELPPEPEYPAPDTYGGWIEAGRWAYAIRDYETAIADFEEAYKLEPSFTEVNTLLGKAYRAVGELDKALNHLSNALGQSPDDPDSLLETAYCYEDKGDISKAIEHFEKFLVVKGNRNDIRAHVEKLKEG